VLASIVSNRAPALVLLPHTYQTRDFAPRLAARLRKPLVTDVVGIDGTGAEATFSRPMFQGKLVAEVRPSGGASGARVGADRRLPRRRGGAGAVLRGRARAGVRSIAAIRQQSGAAVPGGEAGGGSQPGRAHRRGRPRHQVAGERGARRGARAGARRRAGRLAADLRQRLAADGAADRQLGQTVAPKLYVALGISAPSSTWSA
jgi:electron transfer flavoprotein alpha subunit